MDATRRVGYLGGGLLTVTGVLGPAITGLSAPLSSTGQQLLLLEVDPVQNLLHLGLAGWGATATLRDIPRRTAPTDTTAARHA